MPLSADEEYQYEYENPNNAYQEQSYLNSTEFESEADEQAYNYIPHVTSELEETPTTQQYDEYSYVETNYTYEGTPNPIAATATYTKPDPAPAAQEYYVSMGKFNNYSESEMYWMNLKFYNEHTMRNATPYFHEYENVVGLYSGPFDYSAEASQLCNSLQRIKVTCSVVVN
jgi:hypothetical protein